jgi:chromate transporter
MTSRSQEPRPGQPVAPEGNSFPVRRGTPFEVFRAFLRLGLTSFGGPAAHLGYFRNEFVERRQWLDERSYADLVALCQFLPGPASSQVGMALGLGRAGWAGALTAWIGFTAPSAMALMLFAFGLAQWGQLAESTAIHGLKIAAVAVVAQAVWGMARTLCPDRMRAAFAILAALMTLALQGVAGQVGAILCSGLAGWLLLKLPHPPATPHRSYGVSRRAAVVSLGLFALLLLGLPLVAMGTASPAWSLIDGFYRAGALVFGGGHVVLPLLQATVVPAGVVSNTEFLAGYGAAQAMPGPLFTFAAYLGAVMQGPLGGWAGGLLLLCVVFAPGFLLVVGALHFWDAVRQRPVIQSALAGVNAGVVGILLAALFDPVWTSAIHGRTEFGIALLVFGLLLHGRVSPLLVVLGAALAAQLLLCKRC